MENPKPEIEESNQETPEQFGHSKPNEEFNQGSKIVDEDQSSTGQFTDGPEPSGDKDKEAYQQSLRNAIKIAQTHTFNLLEGTVEVSAVHDFEMFFVGEDSIASLSQKFGSSVFAKETLLETALDELRKKQVLFIQAPNMELLDIAIANIKSLQYHKWPDAGHVLRVKPDKLQEIPFGFWENFRAVSKPTILVIDDNNYDYVRAFMQTKLGELADLHKRKLRESNLYLICQVPDTVDSRQLMSNYSTNLRKQQFAWWEVPVVQEELIKKFGITDGLEVFAEIIEAGIMKYGQTEVYLALQDLYIQPEDEQSIDWSEPNKTDFTARLKAQITKRQNDLKPGLRDLKEMLNAGDPIQKLLIFCGAFFSEISFTDFEAMVIKLLGDDEEEVQKKEEKAFYDLEIAKEKDPDVKRLLIEQKNATLTPAKLKDIFKNELEEKLHACKLTIVKQGRKRKVKFTLAVANDLREYILDKKYPYFRKIYERFRKSSMLFEDAITEHKLKALVRFIVIAAQNDDEQHSAEWLVDLVLYIKERLTVNKPENLDFYSFLQYIERDAQLKGILNLLLGRLTELVYEMVLTEDQEMKEMVKKFFRLLLNEREAREIALKMALSIFRELRNIPDFDQELILSYFKRVFDEGAQQQKDLAYRLIKANFAPPLMYEITSSWISDKKISEDSGTKRIAWYYCLEYCIISIYDYFSFEKRQKDSGDTPDMPDGLIHGRNFFMQESDENFIHSFRSLIQIITNDKCLEVWSRANIFGDYESIVLILEMLVSEEAPAKQRWNTKTPPGIALLGDIVENWFYIMLKTWFDQMQKPFLLEKSTPIQARWKAFATEVCNGLIPIKTFSNKRDLTYWLENEQGNNLVGLIDYFNEKLEFHTEIALRLNEFPMVTKEIVKKLEILRARCLCLELLIRLTQAEIKNILASFP